MRPSPLLLSAICAAGALPTQAVATDEFQDPAVIQIRAPGGDLTIRARRGTSFIPGLGEVEQANGYDVRPGTTFPPEETPTSSPATASRVSPPPAPARDACDYRRYQAGPADFRVDSNLVRLVRFNNRDFGEHGGELFGIHVENFRMVDRAITSTSTRRSSSSSTPISPGQARSRRRPSALGDRALSLPSIETCCTTTTRCRPARARVRHD